MVNRLGWVAIMLTKSQSTHSKRTTHKTFQSRRLGDSVQVAKRRQQGFTLLELMVAMSIFAMLAVAGWQVFDSVSSSKERAKLQFDVISELQYGYGQIQRDMMQAVAYQEPVIGGLGDNADANVQNNQANNPNNPSNGGVGGQPNSSGESESKQQPITPAFQLQKNTLSFVRYADPDPRYAQSDNLERVVYRFSDGNLVRERYNTLSRDSAEHPVQSVVLKEVGEGQFQVLLPEPATTFPEQTDSDALTSQSGFPNPLLAEIASQSQNKRLPKGVQVTFNIELGNEAVPIRWVYALSKLPPEPDKKPVQ